MIKKTIEKLLEKSELSPSEMEKVFLEIMDGVSSDFSKSFSIVFFIIPLKNYLKVSYLLS